jgi:hypothetical protein
MHVSRIRLSAALFSMVFVVGCSTPRSTRPSPSTPAGQPVTTVLELSNCSQTAQVTLHQLVTVETNDPLMPSGRWWDEYTLTIANPSPTALAITSAHLFDLRDESRLWDADRAKLVERSAEAWSAYQQAGIQVVPDIPQLAGLKFVFMAPLAAELAMGTLGTPYGFVLTPFLYGAAIEKTVKLRWEFNQRQLKLPLRLTSGQSAKGSLSFPMTPGPRRLVLRGVSDGQPVEIVIPLTGLSHIHLPVKSAAPATVPATTPATPSS